MQDHPIPLVTEPLQYRAIGLVRGIYKPTDPNCFTRGILLADDGQAIEAVVLGRVLNLMRRHMNIETSHLWVVYPRSRDSNHLHLQISGIWEPSTLALAKQNIVDKNKLEKVLIKDELEEGDDYFSIRGELIYTKPDLNDLVIKVRQKTNSNGSKKLPFKLRLKGEMSLEYIRNFVSLDVRRKGQELHLEKYNIVGPMLTRGGKKKQSIFNN